MIYLPGNSSAARVREAMRARENRLEIVKAVSQGQVSRRDLYKWGILTVTGAIALKNGLSPFANSAYAAVPTGTPRSPMFGAQKFTQPLLRHDVRKPIPLTRNAVGEAVFPAALNERNAKRLSWHTEFTADPTAPAYRNPITGRGPIEGRPPGEVFAHQRWDEFFPKVGYISSWGRVAPNSTRFHPLMAWQDQNSVWTYGAGRFVNGTLPLNLIKARYGEPILHRIYNNTPVDRALNNGFGRNESQLHFHNAHNGSESDGAANVHHFPGTFYDYRWGLTLARRDKSNTTAIDKRASGPDGKGGLVRVPGDYKELQSTLWAHDHRFFFTAENVYKGNIMCINVYSGPDRGNEALVDGVNLRLPSGFLLDYGNLDFDVNLVISDAAARPDGQMFFDIFDTKGFVGDIPLVNMQYAPYFEVLPRRYRFRLQGASMSRFWQLALVDDTNKPYPFTWIGNDGNLFPTPFKASQTDHLAPGERYDIIIDFTGLKPGRKLRFVNILEHADGAGPKRTVPLAEALAGVVGDPCVGPNLEFRIVSQVVSVDQPGYIHRSTAIDRSVIPVKLTDQIPIVPPARTRVVAFGRSGSGDSRQANGQCIPDCPEAMPFPWTVEVNGQAAHSMNANRVSLLIPKPGEIEHWTYINKGGGWDHPIHLHFEEGITMNRGGDTIGPHELLKRKDVWRLRPSGRVQFQVQFGEFGGSYVNHCHNTVHEDFAMLLRMQLLNGVAGSPLNAVTPTPNPTPDGVFFTTPEILPEADPRNPLGTPQAGL